MKTHLVPKNSQQKSKEDLITCLQSVAKIDHGIVTNNNWQSMTREEIFFNV